MKIILTFFVIFFSSSLVAEVYSCSHELSRFNRPGEIETTAYIRNGNIFQNELGWEFIIIKDTEGSLMLMNEEDDTFFTTIINKKTLEFTENYMSIEDSKENESEPLVYGKCILIND